MRTWIWVPVAVVASLSALGCESEGSSCSTEGVQAEASPLSQAAGPAGPAGPACSPGCAVRIDALESQIATLRGAFTALQTRVTGAEGRLGTVESGLAALGSVPLLDSVSVSDQVRPPAIDFGPLPGLDLDFTTTTAGPASFWFYGNAAQLYGFANTGLLFRLMVDDVEVISGSRVREDFIDDRRLAALMQFHWTVEDVPPGAHTARVEWIGLTGTPSVPENATMDSRTLTVAHAR